MNDSVVTLLLSGHKHPFFELDDLPFLYSLCFDPDQKACLR